MKTPLETACDKIEREMAHAMSASATETELADLAARKLSWALGELRRLEAARVRSVRRAA